jgi:hypothetical protein
MTVMEITPRELRLLNFYRASELHGGLLLGSLVRRERDAELTLRLTRHSAEEVRHAELWTQAILDVGGEPSPTEDTYQERYAAVLAGPLSTIDVLALTQIFERRVYRHFLEHERRPGTHPRVRECLRTMIEEERDHLSWVWAWLNERAGLTADELRDIMSRFQQVDDRVYATLRREYYEWPAAA